MEVNLVFVTKNGTTQTFPMPSPVTFLGRRQDCDMCIPLSVVSRRHCEIFTEHNKVNVRDLKSRNGTFVNDEPIEEAQIKAGDVLRIGPVKFVVQIDGEPVSFENYLPVPSERQPDTIQVDSPQVEKKEADIDEIIEDMPESIGGQSQTMDIDEIFNDDILGDGNLGLDSDLLNE